MQETLDVELGGLHEGGGLQDGRLNRVMENQLTPYVTFIINDGIVTDAEIRLVLGFLKGFGIEDNAHTQMMVRDFFLKELSGMQYAHTEECAKWAPRVIWDSTHKCAAMAKAPEFIEELMVNLGIAPGTEFDESLVDPEILIEVDRIVKSMTDAHDHAVQHAQSSEKQLVRMLNLIISDGTITDDEMHMTIEVLGQRGLTDTPETREEIRIFLEEEVKGLQFSKDVKSANQASSLEWRTTYRAQAPRAEALAEKMVDRFNIKREEFLEREITQDLSTEVNKLMDQMLFERDMEGLAIGAR